jgi:ribonuclease J
METQNMSSVSITNFNSGSIRIIPFGGCGEFGMNMTGYICDDRLYLVDAGISFPDPSKLGIEAIFPNMGKWISQFGGVYAYIITHGHEDHIGALPYMLEKWPGPVYATPWAAALIENKLQRRGVTPRYPINRVRPGDRVQCEDFSIEYVAFNHSIPDACGLMIRQGGFNIFHTGDFKLDATPVMEKPADLSHLKKLGSEGVHLLLADSTNSHLKGYCPSEKSVVAPLQEAFDAAGNGSLIVTTFSSNFWRLKTILDLCVANKRKVLILGGGLDSCLKIASATGLFAPPKGLIIEPSEVSSIERRNICVLATGSQGEWRSALMRMAKGEHKLFSITPGDLVAFSSRTIPGNERIIQYMMSLLERRGARIFSARNNPLVHVSGHGYRDEIKDLLSALKPKFFIPVHGTFSHLTSNSLIPAEAGLSDTRSFVIENGDVIDVDKGNITISDRIDIEHFYVDSESYNLIAHETLRERLRVGELGLVVVALACNLSEGQIVGEPKIDVFGLVNSGEEKAQQLTTKISDTAISGFHRALKVTDETADEVEDKIRIEVRRMLFQVIGKKPVVVCKLISV